MNYYISDLHLGHKNIIHMCKRPFRSVEEMDNTIIDNCNNVAGENDDLYVIGDFCYKCPDPVKYISRFNAHVHLITGNHDIKMLNNRAYSRKFASVQNYLELIDGNTRIVLSHYPITEWNGYWRNPKALHLYGHIHNNINNAANIMGKIDGAYNVGADLLGFVPRTLQWILENKPGHITRMTDAEIELANSNGFILLTIDGISHKLSIEKYGTKFEAWAAMIYSVATQAASYGIAVGEHTNVPGQCDNAVDNDLMQAFMDNKFVQVSNWNARVYPQTDKGISWAIFNNSPGKALMINAEFHCGNFRTQEFDTMEDACLIMRHEYMKAIIESGTDPRYDNCVLHDSYAFFHDSQKNTTDVWIVKSAEAVSVSHDFSNTKRI